MEYIIEIVGSRNIAGVNAARVAYNEANAEIEGFTALTTEEYVQFVMSKAAESYASQYSIPT